MIEYRRFTVHFDGGASVEFIAADYRYYFTGHYANKSGKIFEVAEEWYHPSSARLAYVDVDRIVAISVLPFD